MRQGSVFSHHAASPSWWTAVSFDRYDRHAELSTSEQDTLAQLVGRIQAYPFHLTEKWRTKLARLVTPLQEMLCAFRACEQYRGRVIRLLLIEMHRRRSTFWAWSAEEWMQVMRMAQMTLAPLNHSARSGVKTTLLAIAYVVGNVRDFYLPPEPNLSRSLLASKVFGEAAIEQAHTQVCTVLTSWGYAEKSLIELRNALSIILLINGSPLLSDISLELLEEVRQRANSHVSSCAYAISRALKGLGMLEHTLPPKAPTTPMNLPRDTSTIHPTWLAYCDRWRQTTLDLSEETRYKDYGTLLKCGRWLSHYAPEITSPQQWTHATALAWVAAVDTMCVGDFDGSRDRRCYGDDFGKPLMPRSKYQLIAAIRRFFRDLQDDPFNLPRRFNPERACRVPRQVMRRIGPAPRDIKALTWARLVNAACTLLEADLPHANNTLHYPLSLVRAVAVVWCYAGLRVNEIRRLRVGCIRFQEEDVTVPETGEVLPRQAVCFLTVPVSKTNTTQVKPVNPLVGKVIREWEKERPPQPPSLDAKTGERIDALFCLRGLVISENYLNSVLIPRLCEKAGLPNGDERGKFTSHRARSTVATLLYNAPEGFSLEELAAWLGHQYLSSTQHYAALKPKRLAIAYTRAQENSVLVSTLVDLEGGVNNLPKIYTVLDDGGLCSNPEWVTCPVRMACKKCQFHVPTEVARVILARKSVRKMLQMIDLRPEERTALEEDEHDLTETIQRVQRQGTPRVLHRRSADGSALELPVADFFTEEALND